MHVRSLGIPPPKFGGPKPPFSTTSGLRNVTATVTFEKKHGTNNKADALKFENRMGSATSWESIMMFDPLTA